VKKQSTPEERPVRVKAGAVELEGSLCLPENAPGIVIFAHGSGSSRLSPRNQYVARELRTAGLGTLLFDLLTKKEEETDLFTAELRFDIGLLADRLIGATDWLTGDRGAEKCNIGYFGASTGAAAALTAAAERPDVIKAVVSRGGRPDLAGEALPRVKAPTLLIVGGNDTPVIAMNRDAMRYLKVETKLEIIPRATHLFEETGALEKVAHLASDWFGKYLKQRHD
jgi:putative phosphoribosyl transferase